MEIKGDFRPVDPAARKRQADAAAGRTTPSSDATPTRSDAVELGDTSPQAIARYVELIKAMNPADLHRVEELRARIADGSFTATPDELADLLDDQLERGDL
jgi:flagellar biosynthesis anti-sigma factor FlgM